MVCRARLSQPSSVALRPGVPDSMKSCASKWERVGSGEPTAWTMASCPLRKRGSIGASLARLGDRYCGTHAVVVWFAEGDDYVEAVHGAALEEDDHFLLVGRGSAGDGALEERWECGHAEHGDAAVF